MEHRGFTHSLTERLSRLYYSDVNSEYVKAKYQELSRKFEHYEFRDYNLKEYNNKILSDDVFAAGIAQLVTECMNDIPHENLQIEDKIYTAEDIKIRAQESRENTMETYNIIAFDGDKVIGKSNVDYPTMKPVEKVETKLTGVIRDYRKQGLATYLKILMIMRLLEMGFEYIETENNQQNVEMLHINHSLGFKFYREWSVYSKTIS